MNPNADAQVVSLLSSLHRNGKFSLIWTRPSRTSHWFAIGDVLPEILDGPRNQDIYFQVHPSKVIPTLDESGVEQPASNVRGRLADLDVVNCLFADFDAAAFGGDLNEVRKYVASLSDPIPPPTFIVCSGGGLHAYWVFAESWCIETNADRQRASQLQHAWVELVGGDRNAADMARVLRLPGTINHKPTYGPNGVPVTFDLFDPNQKYSREILEALVAPASLEPRADAPRRQTRPVTAEKLEEARLAMADLSVDRASTYSSWIEIGMALSELDDAGLAMWREWSARSNKYRRGECEYKWGTFKPHAGITLGTLFERVAQDRAANAPGPHITRARRPITTHQTENALEELGLHFAINEMTGVIHANGEPLDDSLYKIICGDLYNHKYTNEHVVDMSITRLAAHNRFHPIRDYLNGLAWDHDDHIGKLCSYFADKNDVLRLWLPRWIVGAVARVMLPNVQNRVLVLDGPQNLGKSYFAQWIFSPLPDLFVEAAIAPDDKDCRMRRAFVWGWEIDELGASLRRQDMEAIKSFITTTAMVERVPYGRIDRRLKPVASFIGTINNQAGFLNDQTGSRRFMVATLTRLDWRYAADVNIHQVWAQAVYMLRNDFQWGLTSEEHTLSEKLNREEYQVSDPLEEVVGRMLTKDPSKEFSSAELMGYLELGKFVRSVTDRGDSMRVAAILRTLGLVKKKVTVSGIRREGWGGAEFNMAEINIITVNGSVSR